MKTPPILYVMGTLWVPCRVSAVSWWSRKPSNGLTGQIGKNPFTCRYVFMSHMKKYEPVSKNHDEAQYFANVKNIDLAVGKLMEKIVSLGEQANILVIFTSNRVSRFLDWIFSPLSFLYPE